MVYTLKLYLASSVLFSIATYVYMGFKNIHTQSEDFKQYLKEIVTSSIIITFFSVLFVIKTILIDYNNNSKLIFYGILVVLILFVLFFFFILKNNQHKHVWKSKRFKILTLVLSVVFIFILLFDRPMFIYRLSLLFYLASNINLFRIALSKKFREHITGICYMLLSNITVIVVNAFYPTFNINFILIITISMQILTVVGMMLFYSSYHLMQLDDSKNNLKSKNEELKELYLTLKTTVYVDSITGLPNKNSFIDSIDSAQSYQTIALINVKNFKHINQLVGFNRGNEFLREISSSLSSKMCETSYLYRYDADQFLLVSHNTTDTFKKSFESFRADELIIDNIHVDYYCSIIEFQGINDILALLNMLEVGLSKAKSKKNRLFHLDAEAYSKSKDIMTLTLKLKQAVKDKCFEIYYQPKYALINESIVSYEALIRWYDGDKFIPPGIFIPISEEEDLIDEISRIVIHKVFDMMTTKWHKKRTISINLSVQQLIDDSFIDFIVETTAFYKINPCEIIFEVTETMLLDNLKLVQYSIARLKKQGFKLSLDDFGSGASSLYRFAKLDFDEVKFDRSFVTDMAIDHKVYTTFAKTVELFKAYDMTIVAEGIETLEQLNKLRTLDIDQIQGYYYSRPLPFEEVLKL